MFGLEKNEVTRPPMSPKRDASTHRSSAVPRTYCPTPIAETMRSATEERKTSFWAFSSLKNWRAENQIEVKSAAVSASIALPYLVRTEAVCKSKMSSTKKSAKSSLDPFKKDFKDHKNRNRQIGKSQTVECSNSWKNGNAESKNRNAKFGMLWHSIKAFIRLKMRVSLKKRNTGVKKDIKILPLVWYVRGSFFTVRFSPTNRGAIFRSILLLARRAKRRCFCGAPK